MKIEIFLPDNAVCGHLLYITTESGEDGKPAENCINAGYLNELEDGIQYDFVKQDIDAPTIVPAEGVNDNDSEL